MSQNQQTLNEWIATLPPTIKEEMKKVVHALRSEYDFRQQVFPGFFYDKVRKEVSLPDVYEILKLLHLRRIIEHSEGTHTLEPDAVEESISLNMDLFPQLESLLEGKRYSSVSPFIWHPLHLHIDWVKGSSSSGVLTMKDGTRFRFSKKTFEIMDRLINADGQPVKTKELKQILNNESTESDTEIAKWKSDLMKSRPEFAKCFDIVAVPPDSRALILKSSDSTITP